MSYSAPKDKRSGVCRAGNTRSHTASQRKPAKPQPGRIDCFLPLYEADGSSRVGNLALQSGLLESAFRFARAEEIESQAGNPFLRQGSGALDKDPVRFQAVAREAMEKDNPGDSAADAGWTMDHAAQQFAASSWKFNKRFGSFQ